MDELQDFLNKHKTSEKAFTHTSIGLPFKGKFNILDNELESFFKVYEKAIASGAKVSITEKHKDSSPVVIDVDFRFSHDTGTSRKYTLDHIKKIVSYYQEELALNFNGDTTAYVMEKGTEGRIGKKEIKDGLHIIFPNMVVPCIFQLVTRKNVVKKIKRDNVLKDIPLSNDEWDIFDEAVIKRNPWLLYGSSKPDDTHSWTVTHVFDKNMVSRTMKDENLIKKFSIRNKEHVNGFVSEETEKNYREIHETDVKPKAKKTYITNVEVDEATVSLLVSMLNKKRADDYKSWIELGWCLYNISPSILHIWEEFSQNSEKYIDGKCEEVWSKIKSESGLNMGTLYYWAREDSPEEYKKFKQERGHNNLYLSLKQQTDYSIARVLYTMFGHKYVLASLKDDIWYEFVGHKWKRCEKGIFLRKRISTDLYEAYKEFEKRWTKQLDENLNNLTVLQREEKRHEHEEMHGLLTMMYKKLNTTKHKNDIMKAAQELFYYDDRTTKKFIEKLDSNRNLIGFENGIYDLHAPKLDEFGYPEKDEEGRDILGVFRQGKPTDCVSLSTGINYIELDVTSEKFYRVQSMIEQILPDKPIRKYVLTMLSYCLSGYISEEKLWMLVGTASNGKSALLELFKHSFGDYFQTVSPKILTTKRGSPEGASPELAKLKGARYVGISEPEKTDEIQGGFTKLLSGGDDISCRGLYKDPISFKPQFTMNILTNYFLAINTTDDGIFRRLRAVEFKVKFCDDPEEGNRYERKIDRKLKENFPDWAETFMSILIEYHRVYQNEGLIEPEEVLVYTRKYKEDVDILAQFMADNIVKSELSRLTIRTVYTAFKAWFREQHNSNNIPIQKDFKIAMEKKYGPMPKMKGWLGLALVEEDGEEDTKETKENKETKEDINEL